MPHVLPRAAYLAMLDATRQQHQTWLTTRLAGLTERPSIWDLAIEYGVPWSTMFTTVKRFRAEGGVLPPRRCTWNVRIYPSMQGGVHGWYVSTRRAHVARDGLWFADRGEALAFKTHWQERKGRSPTMPEDSD